MDLNIIELASNCAMELSEEKLKSTLMEVNVSIEQIEKNGNFLDYCLNVVNFLNAKGMLEKWLLVLQKEGVSFAYKWKEKKLVSVKDENRRLLNAQRRGLFKGEIKKRKTKRQMKTIKLEIEQYERKNGEVVKCCEGNEGEIREIELEKRLGKGRFGVVHKVHCGEKCYAFKVFTDVDPDNENYKSYLKSFKKEFKASQKIDNPYVAKVYQFGHCNYGSGNLPYLLMEFVEGKTLDEFKKNELDYAAKVKIAKNIIEGLACVHEAGIVHRDIKLDNIMVNNDGIAKILDFGISHFGLNTASFLTRTTDIAKAGREKGRGHALFLAPELWKTARKKWGIKVEKDPRYPSLNLDLPIPASDVFALGTGLYKMFTGEMPYCDGEHEILYMLVDKEFKVEPLIEHNPKVEPKWNDLVLKCLKRPLEHRFVSAVEILNYLGKLHLELPNEIVVSRENNNATKRGENIEICGRRLINGKLDLMNTNVKDENLLKLAGNLHVRELCLSETGVTDEGLKHLSQLFNLKILYLTMTKISNKGLEYLLSLTNLEELYLSSTKITDKGLNKLWGFKKLRHVWLKNIAVVGNGVVELEKKLPNCEVHTDFKPGGLF